MQKYSHVSNTFHIPKMKKALLVWVLLQSLWQPVSAQWEWAQSGTSAISWDEGYGVASDLAGNCYVIGMFSSASIDFGTFSLTNANAGMDDMFVVKYSPTGNPLWAHCAGGTNYDYGMAIATDTQGNVIITGHYYSSAIIFGNDTLSNTPGGGTDIYTVKYTPGGNELWATNAGGNRFDESSALCTDIAGNIYLAGFFYSSYLTFGSYTLTNTDTNSTDIFIVKYDTSGNVVWAKSAGGISAEAITGIATDGSGNIIITGSSGSQVCNFGAVSITNTGAIGADNVFIVKYDSNGNALWGTTGEGPISESGAGVATDTAGNIYVTGTFTSPFIVFGNDTLSNARPMGGPGDFFIVKYDASGTELWAKRGGSRFIDFASGIVTDQGGNSYITGSYNDTAIVFGNIVLPNSGTGDIFVAKYDNSGNVSEAYCVGSTGSDKSFSICMNPFSGLYITGEFYSSSLSFGATTLVNSAPGYPDVFVAKLALPTGSQELAFRDETKNILYPNPSSGLFTWSSKDKMITKVKVVNSIGDIIYQSQIAGRQATINLTGIAKGIYFVQVMDENKNVVNKKLIVQ